ncbi:hypothetical protein MBLNU13_g03897t1 [Cladosporium sp. NU13]
MARNHDNTGSISLKPPTNTSSQAQACKLPDFRLSALSAEETDVEVICGILQTLQDMDRYGFFFRAQVYSCKRVMFKMVERLSFAVDLEPVELDCYVYGEQE